MSLLSVENARSLTLEGLVPLGHEVVPLSDAHGRVLAVDLKARRNQPPENNSAMDGYAVRHCDITSTPVILDVIGEAPAGHPFAGVINVGQAVRIFTGGVLPQGADTIIIQENTIQTGARVQVMSGTKFGSFVRPRGLDFTIGQTLLKAPLSLRPRDIALAASMNHPEIPVMLKPRIALLSTGDEVVAPGDPHAEEMIVSSNSYGLLALIEKIGGTAINLGIVRDNCDDISHALKCDADIIVTLGGASVGDHDLVREGLKGALSLDFWRVAMRPGKPLMYGQLGNSRFLGLPGNPVSALVCGQIFLKPMIKALLGLGVDEDRPKMVPLAAPLGPNDERQDYLRATFVHEGNELRVKPFERQDSSMLLQLQRSSCFILRPPGMRCSKIGELVPVIELDL
jgi:molybdopterin molybdotransferase